MSFFQIEYYFQTENLLWQCSATIDESARRDSVEMERFWNLQHSKLVNHNGAKMVDVWNVNKLTEARTKMEVAKLRTKAVQ